MDEKGSVTHACGYCKLSNDVCVCTRSRSFGRENATTSQSPVQSPPAIPTNYKAPTVEEVEDEDERQGNLYEDDNHLKTFDGVLEEVRAHLPPTLLDAKIGQKPRETNRRTVEARTFPSSTPHVTPNTHAELSKVEGSQLLSQLGIKLQLVR